LARCPVKTLEAGTDQITYNTSLVELFSLVTEQIWAIDDDKRRAYELRWRINDRMCPDTYLRLASWPITRGDVQPVDFLPTPYDDIAFSQDYDEDLKHLSRLIALLVKLWERAPAQEKKVIRAKFRERAETKAIEEVRSFFPVPRLRE
jgi:hypothetical protein